MLSGPLKDKPSTIVGDKMGTMERLIQESSSSDKLKKPTFFKMRAPIPEQGMDRTLMGATDRMWVFLTTYGPRAGENEMHTHTNEDHSFVVLQGRARFFGPNGEEQELGQYEEIMIPRHVLYTFCAVDGPLVMLRVGCVVDAAQNPFGRLTADGEPLLGNAVENNQLQPIFSTEIFG